MALRPYIVGSGGTALPRSSTAQALVATVNAAKRAGAVRMFMWCEGERAPEHA